MTDCVTKLRLYGNSKQVNRIDIKSSTKHIQATNLINPNQNGMDFPTTDVYTIDIILAITMTIDSITFNSLSNVDSFIVQLHHSHRYYLEIRSVVGVKTIDGLDSAQANLIRIIILGTEDGNPPNHISIQIVRIPSLLINCFEKSFFFFRLLGCLYSNTFTKNNEKSI